MEIEALQLLKRADRPRHRTANITELLYDFIFLSFIS